MPMGKEQAAMIAIFDWVRWNKFDKFIWHTANERQTSIQSGALLKRMGVKSGVSDITISKPSRGYLGAYMEVKIGKNKATQNQINFLKDREEEGYYTSVIWGVDETIERIKWYLGK